MANYNYNQEPQGAESFFELKIDKRTRRFLEAIKDLSAPNILEVGMGQGQFLKKVSRLRPDANLYGIDISEAAVKVAQEDKNLKGEFVAGDAQRLPFPANFFDVAVIMDVLEHLNNPREAILEINRVLKSGGIFHLYVPCENQPFTLDRFLRKTNLFGLRSFTEINFGHIQHFSQTNIEKLVSPYFSKLAVTYSVHWVSQILHILTLYIPKKIISFFGNNVKIKSRDAYRAEAEGETGNSLLGILKKIWVLATFPISIIYEVEAVILKNVSFFAQGLHFTGKKR